jgi:RNA polymerase sigma factor FliA
VSLAVFTILKPIIRAEEPEQALWLSLRETESQSARLSLFEKHLPMARRIAGRFAKRSQAIPINFDELLQMASEGLLEAIDRFDPNLGVPFRFFANRRIGGSILNGLARYSEVNQQISFRKRLTRDRLTSLKPSERSLQTLESALDALGDIAFGLALGLMLDDGRMYMADEQDPSPNAYDNLAWNQAVGRVQNAVSELPEREQQILRLHYLDGMAFGQVASVLGLTKGRISQIHGKAIALLRARLLQAGRIFFES